ncbi:formyltransferase family protein [Saccharothrix sp. NPDC042600]|uniref:methionyl-tRNA formyltransferase n=1 Tax=Saccharothrix TaxID=2071 RepID=UPI0033CD50F9|nr:methionyl-tRNA formyltransferase [Saccharothrix mutabilis subsp. capreolus]
MRVVLASMGVEEFSYLHETVEAAGHTPVAYVMSRSMRPRRRADPETAESVQEVLTHLPGSVDMTLPADATGVGRALVAAEADLLVVYGFNWILPPEVFGAPHLGAINIHTSALPDYRGPAPVLWAIRNGDPTIGVTIHRIDEGVDTGPVLAQQTGIPLDDDITPERLRERLMPVIGSLLRTALDKVVRGEAGTPQAGAATRYAGLLEPEFSHVDWTRPARQIHDQVRVFRFMGSRSAPLAMVEGTWVRLIRTSLTPAAGPRVECGDGALWIVESEPFTTSG